MSPGLIVDRLNYTSWDHKVTTWGCLVKIGKPLAGGLTAYYLMMVCFTCVLYFLCNIMLNCKTWGNLMAGVTMVRLIKEQSEYRHRLKAVQHCW